MLTRAREANTAYVCTERSVEQLHGFADEPATARSVLTAVLGNVGAAVSADETARAEREHSPSIRTLAAEYETIAHHAQTGRWAGLLTRAGLPADRVDEMTASPAFGALSTALGRAEAFGLRLGAALPHLVARADVGAADLTAVLHERIERWAAASQGAHNDPGVRFILGLIQPATGPDPETESALVERARLMEHRADQLLQRAQAANAPWLRQLGPEPNDPHHATAWRSAAASTAAPARSDAIGR